MGHLQRVDAQNNVPSPRRHTDSAVLCSFHRVQPSDSLHCGATAQLCPPTHFKTSFKRVAACSGGSFTRLIVPTASERLAELLELIFTNSSKKTTSFVLSLRPEMSIEISRTNLRPHLCPHGILLAVSALITQLVCFHHRFALKQSKIVNVGVSLNEKKNVFCRLALTSTEAQRWMTSAGRPRACSSPWWRSRPPV